MSSLFLQYEDILCDKIQYNELNNSDYLYSSTIWKCFINFIKHRNLENGEKTLIISLSGGVDSMVFLYLCNFYKKQNQLFKFGAVHINWNQRNESKREADFIQDYITENNILYHFENVVHLFRNENRELFESKGKELRFNLYKQLIEKWNGDSIFLGHHKGDIIENVFTNMLNGNHLLDLGKMKYESNINGVPIVRPFLDIIKSYIVDIASKYKVPFFKDTTPEWSNRGAIRNSIFPSIDKQFGKGYETGLLNMAKKSRDVGDMIARCLIEPYMNKIEYISETKIRLPYDKTYPLIFYEIMFEKLMYSIGKSKIRNKTLASWHNYTTKIDNWKPYSFSKNCKIVLDNNDYMLLYI